MNTRMNRFNSILVTSLTLILGACTTIGEPSLKESGDWSLEVCVRQMKGTPPVSTKVSYSGPYGEHTAFETGDFFGLFVLDETNTIRVCNYKVYCSGLDNKGKTVWSIFKPGSSDSNTSNHPIADVLAQGTEYFAYFPYNESFSAITTSAEVQSIVPDFLNSLPKDQSSSYSDYDLLVASNIPGCEYGEVNVSGKSVSLTLAHTAAMLRYCIPTGSVKYEYRFDGSDFTPFLLKTVDGVDEFRYVFKPGCVLDMCVKFVKDKKLYKFETGQTKYLWPITTQAGHCYLLDENAPKVPYQTAVDMGTSVMWASFNIGAEDNETATAENIGGIAGNYFMWGANQTTSSFGSSSYANYNKSFTAGTKPNELPLGYDYSGDVIYDAARNLWGGEWRTPSWEEWQELYNACTYTVADGKISFTSRNTGNSIVLPLQGYSNGTVISEPQNGYYWSSTANPSNIAKALATHFRSNNAPAQNAGADRYTGLPIRPVYTR